MVCIYCRSKLSVVNSRAKKRSNQVWRRRSCPNCGSITTSLESIDLSAAIRVKNKSGQLKPFSRDALFISCYESCKHRKTAQNDAAALTDTITSKLLPHIRDATLTREQIVETALEVLQRFDTAAGVHYAAYHPLHRN